MSCICGVLGIGRATDYRAATPRGPRYAKADDRNLVAQLRAVLRERATYGYRRATALVNRHFGTAYNRKRVRRVLELNGWTLPVKTRRRNGRAHTGRVARDGSNERWCSDSLQVACWNGEVVEIGFALDCSDRECLAVVAAPRALSGADIRTLMRDAAQARFGEAKPLTPVQWLSDNGEMHTALETVICAEQLGLAPVTTPAYSPESNGMAEAVVHTLKRDYVRGADLSSAAAVLEQLPRWIADYNGVAPHSALGNRIPLEYREHRQAVVTG